MDPGGPQEVVIPLSRGKLILALLGALSFVALGIWIWSIAGTQSRYHPLYMKTAAVATLSFFGLCAGYACVRIFDTRPGLIIDELGIVDNSSAVSPGRVHWHEVVALNVSEVARQRFLTIVVAEPQRYVQRWNFLGRMLNAGNMKLTGSPVNISSNSLRITFDELVHLLTRSFEEHKKAGRTAEVAAPLE